MVNDYSSPYDQYKRASRPKVNYRLAAVAFVLLLVVIGFSSFKGDETPTAKVLADTSKEETTQKECPTVDEKDCSNAYTKANLEFTTTKFVGVKRYYNINETIAETTITPADSKFLHSFDIGDNHGTEKITYKGEMKGSANPYFDVDSNNLKIGVYFDENLVISAPQKVYFLGEESWVLSKSSSQLILGELILDGLFANQETRTIEGKQFKIEAIEESTKKVRVSIGGSSETVDEGKYEEISSYYVYLERTYEKHVQLKVFNPETVQNDKKYDDNFEYFFTADSFGLRNHRGLDINRSSVKIKTLEVNVDINNLNYEEVRFTLIKSGTEYKAVKMEMNSSKIKTSDGNLGTVYIFSQNKQCKTLSCISDEYINVYGLDLPVYIPITYNQYDITLHEPSDIITLDIDKSNAEIDGVIVEDLSENEISGSYTPFGSLMKERNLIDGKVTIHVTDKQKKVEFSIGRTETVTQDKTLSVNDDVNIDETNVKLKELN